MTRSIRKPLSQGTMLKVARSPGICTQEEIEGVLHWLEDFNKQLALYRSVHGEPIGMSVDSKIDIIKKYVK